MKCCKLNHFRSINLIDRVLPSDGRIDNDDLSAVFPVDPVTNLPLSDLELINRSDTPQSIKDALDPNFVRLPDMSVNVDETTKSITLRPRNCQSFAEVSRFGTFLKSYSDSLLLNGAATTPPEGAATTPLEGAATASPEGSVIE